MNTKIKERDGHTTPTFRFKVYANCRDEFGNVKNVGADVRHPTPNAVIIGQKGLAIMRDKGFVPVNDECPAVVPCVR